MANKEDIFIWIAIIFVIIVITAVFFYIIVKNPGNVDRKGGLDVIPVSEPPDPVGLTYACQSQDDCQTGMTCDPYDNTCRMSEGSSCLNGSDCVSGLICSGTCISPNDPNIDIYMNTYVDNRYVCNPYGLAVDKGAAVNQTGNPQGAFCCRKCQPGDKGCTPGTTCGPTTSQDGYTISCGNTSRKCPCQQGKACVKSYNNKGYECRVLPDNPCVCDGDCVTRRCTYYADGTSSKYPVGICGSAVANGNYCTIDESCISKHCSINPDLVYGFCQPPNIENGQTGASCNITADPRCDSGNTCVNSVCESSNAFGFNSCDSNNICADSFFCAVGALSPVTGSTGQISINTCDGSDNCICLYGNGSPGTNMLPNNINPDPNGVNYLIANCMNGMFRKNIGATSSCIPSVIITPSGFTNSAPCYSNDHCNDGTCSNGPAVYRFTPLVTTEFPVDGLQGLNGVYYERIPLPFLTKKTFGVSINWSVKSCELSEDTCQTLIRGSDILFAIGIRDISYKTINNGPSVSVGPFVMDGGDPSNRSSSGWNTLVTNSSIIDADAFWSNGNLYIYILFKNLDNTYSVYRYYLDQTSGPAIKMPSVPNPGWTSISCSDYTTTGEASIMLSNGVMTSYCPNVGLAGTWTTIANTPGKVSLGYGAYKNNDNYFGYPVYGKTTAITNAYKYFDQPPVPTKKSYVYSKVRYPQNTYISNLSASVIGTYKPITPTNGSSVSDFSIPNVSMTTPDGIVRFLHFAYIAKWGTSNDYYVYYVGGGFSIVLPTYCSEASRVIITPGNLYIYSPNGCI